MQWENDKTTLKICFSVPIFSEYMMILRGLFTLNGWVINVKKLEDLS